MRTLAALLLMLLSSVVSADDFTTSDYLTLSTGTGLSYTDQLTISAWINIDTFTNSAAIVAKDDVGSNRNFLFYNDSAVLYFHGFASVGITPAGTALNTGQWYFVSATYDGSTKAVRVDGAAYTSSSGSGNLGNGNISTRIMRDGGTANLDGRINFVGIDNTKLSNAELSARMYGANQVPADTFLPIMGDLSPYPDVGANGFSGAVTGNPTSASGPPTTWFGMGGN